MVLHGGTLVRRGACAGACVVLLAAGPATALRPPTPGQEQRRYVVQLTDGTDVAAETRALRSQGLAVGRRFSHALKGVVVTTTPRRAATLSRAQGVVAVAPDAPVRASDSWGLDRIDQRSLPLSGTFTPPGTGSGVDVYVVDTGVRADHVDLVGRVAAGFSVVVGEPATEDCSGHGTHVAGTAAGATYGVARRSSVVPVRVLGCDGGGSVSDVLAGLDWVARTHVAGEPAVVNLSLTASPNAVLDAGLQGVVDDGVTATVAAGNAGADACDQSPGRLPAALTVAATDDADVVAPFSNGGPCVDLHAPGVAILSAWHSSVTASRVLSGTSMAGPHVAGAAAVVLGAAPQLQPAEVAGTLGSVSTPDVVSGAAPGTTDRLLYIGAPPGAVAPPSAVPALPPTRALDVRARAGVRSALVRWTRGTARGTPITRQSVRVYWRGEHVRTVRARPLATSRRVLRMTPGRAVVFRVVAHSVAGPSPVSARSNRVTIRR